MLFLLGVSRTKFAAWAMFTFSLMSCVGSIYLGYILYYVLHDVCVVCISTYVVNGCLLVINFISLRDTVTEVKKKKE